LIQRAGPYGVELLAQPDGHLVAQVQDGEGSLVPTADVVLSAEILQEEDDVVIPLVVNDDRYVGTITGVRGSHPVTVVVVPQGTPEVTATFPAVELVPVQASLEALHQGEVTVVGDHRFEVATAHDGQVTVSVTNLQGAPVAPASVELEQVTLVTPRGPRVVRLEAQGGVFVGALGVPPPPSFSVSFNASVGGHVYQGVHVRRYHPLPMGVVVAPPPIFSAAVVAPSPPVPVPFAAPFGVHPGKGWHKGHRHKGHFPGKGWHKGHRNKGHFYLKGPGKAHYRGRARTGHGGRGKGHGWGHGRGRGKGHGKRR
jgi:hypothetical protein